MPFEWFVALRYLREGKLQTASILGLCRLALRWWCFCLVLHPVDFRPV